jgi:hypothetical protein
MIQELLIKEMNRKPTQRQLYAAYEESKKSNSKYRIRWNIRGRQYQVDILPTSDIESLICYVKNQI